MSKTFVFEAEAREKMLNGAKIVARSVGSTLGPRGKLVLIEQQMGTPRVTKDGVSVARSALPLKDPFENMGAQMMVESSSKTLADCGDGTTTSCVLAERIITEGAKLIAASHNSIDIKRGIDWAVQKVIDELILMSKKITDQKEIEQVATISSNNDSEIGKLITEAMDKVGNDGVINLSEGKTLKTEVDVVNGYRFDKGYLSLHFATNEKLECVLENPLVLVYDKTIANVNIMLPILKKCRETYPNRPLFITAETVDGEAIATLLVNHLKRLFISCAVKNPGFGDKRRELLSDIAVLTNAQVIDENIGMKLENFDINWLGSAKKIVITKNNTTIIDGAGSEEKVKARIEEIRNLIQSADGEYEKEKEEERLAKLVGGVAVISVGGATETEMKEKKDRVEDALSATKAAVEEGIVAGGGVALLRAALILDKIEIPLELQAGARIIRKAAEEPLRKITENCGLEPAEIRLKILESDNNTFGFNARTEKFEDLVATGIIDPAKVVRCALQNAASVAGLVLTTECMIADDDNKKDQESM